jgi:hypothetical protein
LPFPTLVGGGRQVGRVLGNWAMMKSQSDYFDIKHALKGLAEKYHTQLPVSACH